MKYFISIGLIIPMTTIFLSCTSKQSPTPPSNPIHERSHLIPKKKEEWTCAMHPQIRQDHPGQCPICGMNLIKVEESDSLDKKTTDPFSQEDSRPDHHNPFHLSSERSQMIGVKVGVVESKPVFKDILAAGRLAFDPELYTAQNEYVEALRQYERVKDSPLDDIRHSAQRMVKSSRLRLKVLGLSDQQIASIGTSENTGANYLIHREGQPVWIYAEIYEMDLPFVHPGQSAEISAGFLAGKSLNGKVISVDRVINPNTRTAKARIQINEGTSLLRPESYVDVLIKAPLGRQVVVPFDAIFDTGRQSWVFVVDDQNNYYPKKVNIKFYANDAVAISAGLSGGERIVTSANFLIDSESRLKAVSQSQTTPAQSQPSCPKEQHWDQAMSMCMPN